MNDADPFVPFRLTICGVEELAGHCAAEVSHVLSILDPESPAPEAFGAYGEHERLELRFHDIIEDLPDRLAPQQAHVEAILAFGRDLMAEPERKRHLLVHCQMGVSRSTAAMLVILAQARPDRPATDALAAVRRIRPRAWPNLRIVELGDALLGRGGRLVVAAHEHYRYAIDRRPELVEEMTRYGRGREVAGL